LRLATFNILHGRSLSAGDVSSERLVDACSSLDADVLALQEVDRARHRSGRVDQAARIARQTRAAHVFGAAVRSRWRGEYGNALLVRGVVTEAEVLTLPRHGQGEPRVAILASAVVAGARLSVAATHLSVHPAESHEQLVAVVTALVARPLPRLLLGDLNLGPHEVAPTLDAAGMALVDPSRPTYPAHDPRLRIDHAAVAGLEVEAVHARRLAVSDHRALVVTLSG
jgi:endonuclease/exonuclease/phosphatase family metal-dependent hydrolase